MLVMTLLDNVECTFDPCQRNCISLFQSTHARDLKQVEASTFWLFLVTYGRFLVTLIVLPLTNHICYGRLLKI